VTVAPKITQSSSSSIITGKAACQDTDDEQLRGCRSQCCCRPVLPVRSIPPVWFIVVSLCVLMSLNFSVRIIDQSCPTNPNPPLLPLTGRGEWSSALQRNDQRMHFDVSCSLRSAPSYIWTVKSCLELVLSWSTMCMNLNFKTELNVCVRTGRLWLCCSIPFITKPSPSCCQR